MAYKRTLSALATLLLIPILIRAQDPFMPDTTIRTRHLVEDDQVVVMLDSLTNLKIFEDTQFPNAGQYQDWSTYSDTDIPVFSDSVYFQRIVKMNGQSPFEYVFNADVKKFIDLYGVKKRKLTARILGLSQIYFPLFEEQLDRFNMPLELKYLAVIESALNPVANSPAGAKGLWQFMYGTGKVYGLKVSTYVDDRFDPYKSTIAACEHLTDLYDIYGSWSLALAAYNSGAGNVNKAIRRAGGVKNFWAIKPYLPRETASYVPAFIAASYVMHYAKEHKIFPVDPGILYYEVDTVTVHKPLSFDQISEMLGIPMDEIVFLNPSFKQRVIPASAENPYRVRLRKKYVGNFINNEAALYAFKTRDGMAADALEQILWNNYRESGLYTVKSGETVASIAKKFHMTTAELKSLNGLKKNTIKSHRKILVYTTPPRNKATNGGPASTYVPQPLPGDTTSKKDAAGASQKSGTAAPPPAEKPAATIYTVKGGDNLGKIAAKYGCSTADLVRWNNLKGSTILVGQKLKVAPPGETASATSVSSSAKPASGSKPKTATPGSSQKFTWYTVVAGDNLWDIAERFNVTVAQIKSLNKFGSTSRLVPGQKIKIPK